MPHTSVTPVVERAVATGDPDELVALLTGQVRLATLERFHRVALARERLFREGEPARPAYDAAALRLDVWARTLTDLAWGERTEAPVR